MTSKKRHEENRQFVNDLFGKVFKDPNLDKEMIDLADDDAPMADLFDLKNNWHGEDKDLLDYDSADVI